MQRPHAKLTRRAAAPSYLPALGGDIVDQALLHPQLAGVGATRPARITPASRAAEHPWKDLGRPWGRPCDWLVEADQDDQDDPLTVHRPARTLRF